LKEYVAVIEGVRCRLAVLELGQPTFPPARWFVKYCVPFIGAMLSGGARAEYEHLEKSVLNFHSQEFATLIEEAGLTLNSVRMMNFGGVGLYVAQKPLAPAPAAHEAHASAPPAVDTEASPPPPAVDAEAVKTDEL